MNNPPITIHQALAEGLARALHHHTHLIAEYQQDDIWRIRTSDWPTRPSIIIALEADAIVLYDRQGHPHPHDYTNPHLIEQLQATLDTCESISRYEES